MIVTDIKTRIVNLNFPNTVIVKVETDECVTGISETVMKRKTHTIEQSILELQRYLIGKDPTEIENHWGKIYRDSFWVGGPMQCTAISAVDCVLWDILGKVSGLPVFKLFGGPTRQRVPAFCHCSAGETPEEFAQNAKACIDRGCGAVKTTLPMFYGRGKLSKEGELAKRSGYSGTDGIINANWKETEYLNPSTFERIHESFLAAREIAGPDLGIALDCHGRLNPKSAIQLCRMLEDVSLLFLEEPVPPENADELCLVQREAPMPIAAEERWPTIYGVLPFVEKHAVDILQCDLMNCGGFTRMKKIVALAEAHYIGMAPHNPNGPLRTVMILHYVASIPNVFILETNGSQADDELAAELIDQPPQLVDGEYGLPGGPGFGVELNEEYMERHPYVPRRGSR